MTVVVDNTDDTHNDPFLALQGTLGRVSGRCLLWLRLGADGWLRGRRWLGGRRLAQRRVLVGLHIIRHFTQSCITAHSQLSLLPSVEWETSSSLPSNHGV